ncbi:MAG: transposase [Balneolaceae bacterium]
MNPRKKQNNRRSIRLQGYNYSSPGEYFITICTHNRKCLFGDVVDGEMRLNECGVVAEDFWRQIPKRYENAILDEFVVMPNHIHGIIGIEFKSDSHPVGSIPVGAIHELPLRDDDNIDLKNHQMERRKMLLPKIIGWYKMNVSKQVNILLENTGHRFWQRNYYEHIIRNDKSLHHIRNYIINNPLKWQADSFHTNNSQHDQR